jgi:hypothetical protein
MSALQRELAKSRMASSNNEHDNDNDSPWSAAARRQAVQDMEAGTFKTLLPGDFPVILTPDGPVSSAEELQQLAELDSLPETIDTIQIRPDGTELKRVKICLVSFEDRKKMKEKADVSSGIGDNVIVVSQGEQRYAMVVNLLDKGAPAGGPGQCEQAV